MLLTALEDAAGNPTLTDRGYSPTIRQEYHKLRDPLPASAVDWITIPEHHLQDGPWPRLGEFEVYGDIRSDWVMLVLPLMPSLTRLKLRTTGGFPSGHIQIERVLRDCKRLEHLHISRVDGRKRLPGPWVPVVPSSTAKKGFGFSSVSLKSLVLEKVTFKQVVSETFLEHALSLNKLIAFDAVMEGKYITFKTASLAKLLKPVITTSLLSYFRRRSNPRQRPDAGALSQLPRTNPLIKRLYYLRSSDKRPGA